MAEYREVVATALLPVPVEGSSWVRGSRIIIDNPWRGVPSITLLEEKITVIGDSVRTEYLGPVVGHFNPEYSFPLRNPLNDELLGVNGTEAELQVLLYSRCRQLQEDRDRANNIE